MTLTSDTSDMMNRVFV